MRYKISKSRTQRVNLPPLTGGINVGNESSQIADNQLSAAVNMYVDDGILKTRPGFSADRKVVLDTYAVKKVKHYHILTERGFFATVWEESKIHFVFFDSDEKITVIPGGEILNEWSALHGVDVYSFVKTSEGCFIYKNFEPMDESEIYIPVIFTNGKSDGNTVPELNGDFINGYNLLNNKYKVEYTAYNPNTEHGNVHPARYRLPHTPPENSKVRVEITHEDGSKTEHSVTVFKNEDGYIIGEEEKEQKGVAITIDGDVLSLDCLKTGIVEGVTLRCTLYVCSEIPSSSEGESEDFDASYYYVNRLKNNITITAEYEVSNDSNNAKDAIFSATTTQWFGGGRGLASGTRLFVGGMEGEFGNVLQWSGLSNPLYFPADCNSEVGEVTDAITCIAKQNDMLVILKNKEIFYASYSAGSIDSVNPDTAMDLTVATAVFPLTHIPSTVGCDIPSSVQLCGNRLVWTNSNGKVYTLVNASQYNEKSVYELSGPVHNTLRNVSGIENAMSCEWGSYYVLAVGRDIFLMDYTSYGYRYIYSYKNEEAAEVRIPWFYFRLPMEFKNVYGIGNKLYGISVCNDFGSGDYSNRGIVLYSSNAGLTSDFLCKLSTEATEWTETEEKYISMFQTKFFDFKYPEMRKRISSLFLELGSTDGETIKVSYITDKSKLNTDTSEAEKYGLNKMILEEGSKNITPQNDAEEQVPDSFRIIPQLNFIRKLAVRVESEGPLAVGSVSIDYKMLGSVK